MMMINTSTPKFLIDQLQLNSNSQTFKDVIKDRIHSVQQVAYLYFTTTQQNQYMEHYRNLNIEQNQIRKNRIKQITDDAFNEFMQQLEGNKPINQQLSVHSDIRNGSLAIEQLIKDYPSSINDYFSPNHPRTRQAQQKLKIINEDLNKFKEKAAQMKRKNEYKKIQQLEAQQQARKKIEQEKRQKYKEQVVKKVEENKEKMQERKKQNVKFKQFLKQFKSSKPLHVLMEEEYLVKVQLPLIQQKNKKYNEKKVHPKPTLEQINNHQKQYLRQKMNRPQKHLQMHQTIDVGYKSKFYLNEEKKLLGYSSSDSDQNISDLNQRRRRYSQLVKVKFKPKIKIPQQQSENDQESQQINKKQQRKTMEVPDRSKYIEIGKNYLEYVKGLQKKRLHSSQSELIVQDNQGKTQKQSRYINYLQDLKNKHTDTSHGTGSNWEVDLRDKTSSAFQRRDRVLMKSKQLQQRAFRKQQYLSLYSHVSASDALEKKKQIDDTLIQSIRAKVAVLKDVHTKNN